MNLLCLQLEGLRQLQLLQFLCHHRMHGTEQRCWWQNDKTIGQMAWLVAQFHGNLAVSGLTTQKRDEEWASLSMRRLGDNPESLVQLKELIDRTNRERSVPKNARGMQDQIFELHYSSKPSG